MIATELPVGTVTFVFTDIEGSTRLLQRLGDTYADLLDDHHRLLRETMAGSGGVPFGTEGDSMFFAFEDAACALEGAFGAQRALAHHEFIDQVDVRVRVGVDSGSVRLTAAGTYVGMALHRAARICAAARGGQVLVSDATQALAAGVLPRAITLAETGTYLLKDLPDPVQLFEVRRFR